MTDDLNDMANRLKGDLIHDNFVPRYTALNDGEPRLIVVISVWLLFGPMAVLCPFLFAEIFHFSDQPTALQILIIAIVLFFSFIFIAIPVKITLRYIRRRRRCE
jgi:hypothetical protein